MSFCVLHQAELQTLENSSRTIFLLRAFPYCTETNIMFPTFHESHGLYVTQAPALLKQRSTAVITPDGILLTNGGAASPRIVMPPRVAPLALAKMATPSPLSLAETVLVPPSPIPVEQLLAAASASNTPRPLIPSPRPNFVPPSNVTGTVISPRPTQVPNSKPLWLRYCMHHGFFVYTFCPSSLVRVVIVAWACACGTQCTNPGAYMCAAHPHMGK